MNKEISDNDVLKVIDAALQSKRLDISLAVLDAIRPYIHSPEPVSGSQPVETTATESRDD